MKNTYWSCQWLTYAPPSGCSWTKCDKKFLTPGHTTSYVLNSGVIEPNLTKISQKVENWWLINTLKSEFQYSNSFLNATMMNGRRSSFWSQVAAHFPVLRRNYWTDLHQNFTQYSGISGTIESCIYKALVHSISERQSNEWRWSIKIYAGTTVYLFT